MYVYTCNLHILFETFQQPYQGDMIVPILEVWEIKEQKEEL